MVDQLIPLSGDFIRNVRTLGWFKVQSQAIRPFPDTNTPPTIQTALVPATFITGDSVLLNMYTTFQDAETLDTDLVYTVSGNVNIGVVIVNDVATITNTGVWVGEETLVFRATDAGGLFVEESVVITVTEIPTGYTLFDWTSEYNNFDWIGSDVTLPPVIPPVDPTFVVMTWTGDFKNFDWV